MFKNSSCLDAINQDGLAGEGLQGLSGMLTDSRSKSSEFKAELAKREFRKILGNFESKLRKYGVSEESIRAGGLGNSHSSHTFQQSITTIVSEELALRKLDKKMLQENTEQKLTENLLERERISEYFSK